MAFTTERLLVIRVKESEALRKNSGNDNEESLLSIYRLSMRSRRGKPSPLISQ